MSACMPKVNMDSVARVLATSRSLAIMWRLCLLAAGRSRALRRILVSIICTFHKSKALRYQGDRAC